MAETGSRFMKTLDKQRRHYIASFLKSNGDLADRMRIEGVSTVLDAEEDVLCLVIGSVREATSFTFDGELYFRTDIETNKLLSAELHYFSENLHKNTLPFQVMKDLIQLAGSAQLTILPQTGDEPSADLTRDMPKLIEA